MDGGGGVSLLINDTAVLGFYADHMETNNLACAQARIGPLDAKVRPCILPVHERGAAVLLLMRL